jgi:1,4-alpha-glucan branching enzyme
MSIKKQYLKSKPECKVSFKLAKSTIGAADEAQVVGDFTGWQEEAIQMKKLKNGDFTCTVNLPVGKDYQFRYLVDGSQWYNDEEADTYVNSGISTDDNAVITI